MQPEGHVEKEFQSAGPAYEKEHLLNCGHEYGTALQFVLGLHQILYPAPAEIRPNFHIRILYPVPAGYGRRIRGRI